MKPPPPRSPLPRETRHAVLRAVLLYAVFAATWIFLSDSLLAWLFPSSDGARIAGTLKGLLFVAVTSLLLFWLLLRVVRGAGTPAAKVGAGGTASVAEAGGAQPDGDAAGTTPVGGRRGLVATVALFSAVLALLGGGGMLRVWQQQQEGEIALLQSIARLKTTQLESWLEERRRDTEIARGAYIFRETLPRWRASGESSARQRLLARLHDFAEIYRYQAVALCDAQGEILLQAGGDKHGTSAALRLAVTRALAADGVVMTDLYGMREPAPEHVHLDFVAPIRPVAGMPATGMAIVMRVTVAEALYAFLRAWPIQSASGETLLLRRDGEEVLFLSELRELPDAALKLRVPLAASGQLAARALAPGHVPGTVIEGSDYRGRAALGIAYPVAGTDWVLLTQIDKSEAFQAARHGVLWVALASLLTWLVAVTLALLAFQRRELQHAQRHGAEQAEKLRALQLLEAIAASSSDIIFVKDEAGRYVLFNPAAEKFTGRSAAEVLGRDDTTLFPPEVAARLIADDRRVMEEGRVLVFEERIITPEGETVFLATKGPLRDADGRMIGLFGISHDITARAHIEATLRQNNAELERFNRAMIGRELDMVELKRRINALSRELGREAPFDLARLDALNERTGGGPR